MNIIVKKKRFDEERNYIVMSLICPKMLECQMTLFLLSMLLKGKVCK